LGIAPKVLAQGIIIVPPDPIEPWPGTPLTLQTESIEIDLDNQFAHVKITQIFKNNTWQDLEGTYMFPLPPGADISDFALWLDGNELASETLPADQAAQIYHQIVATMRDPGLLEYVGEGLIQAHIYPIPANGTKQVDIEFDWLLPIDTGLMRIDLPLKLDGYSIDLINNLAVTVDITAPDNLGTIYSPTHDVRIDRNGSRNATVSMEKSYHRPQGDFILYISRPVAPVGLNLLTHSTGYEEGYFLAMIAPEYDESSIEVIPKDFVCVLDTSGSMSGYKIEQAKEALDFIFRNLNSDDRFQLITFATDIYPQYRGWSDATRANIEDVRDYIEGISAGGSTNINGALEQALSYEPAAGRPMYVIFLTDGLPTIGETNTARIMENISAINSEVNARLFCFGVGDDVDYNFIDLLSRENGGYTANAGPNEDLEQPLSDFYAKIKSPVLTDLEIEIDGPRIYDMLPTTLPDLFLGSQLILAGRYVGEGRSSIVLTGTVGDESRRFTYNVEFKENRDNDFVPRQWATRRVGYLLNQIRLYGETGEVVDEVIELATRYGIITPYTSMLVTEDEYPMPQGEFLLRSLGNMDSSTGALGAPAAPNSGGYGGGMSAREQSEVLAELEEGAWDMDESDDELVRYAGDKTFYVDDEGYWVDSEYDEEEDYDDTIVVEYLSDEYFDLLLDNSDLSEYFAVGEQLVVVYDGIVYRVDPEE